MQELVERTLFFRTRMLDRVQAGLEAKEAVPCACDKTVVFPHGVSRTLSQHVCHQPQ
jgi:hypothetical protein